MAGRRLGEYLLDNWDRLAIRLGLAGFLAIALLWYAQENFDPEQYTFDYDFSLTPSPLGMELTARTEAIFPRTPEGVVVARMMDIFTNNQALYSIVTFDARTGRAVASVAFNGNLSPITERALLTYGNSVTIGSVEAMSGLNCLGYFDDPVQIECRMLEP